MKVNGLLIILVVLTLTACGGPGNTPTALPTVVLDAGNAPGTQSQSEAFSGGGGVTASGAVIPAQEAQMAFTVAGNVKTVNIAVGDEVKAGQLLVELENVAFQIELNQAQRNLKELTSPAGIAAAAQALAAAQKGLEEAQDKTDGLFYPRASDTLIDNTQGEIDLAKQQLARATDAYRPLAKLPDGDTKKAAALVAMTNAQLQLNALIAKYNWYAGTPSETDAAMARANLEAAKAAVEEAQWYLAALKGEQVPADATGALLAQFQAAKEAVVAAQQRLDATRLVTPFSGTIVIVDLVPGEYATPGKVVVLVSDVTHLKVETTDLSERDVPKVEIGQPVTVLVEALNTEVKGHVSLISPVADTLGGDVVYKTTIDLDEEVPNLRAGMSVEVTFGE